MNSEQEQTRQDIWPDVAAGVLTIILLGWVIEIAEGLWDFVQALF